MRYFYLLCCLFVLGFTNVASGQKLDFGSCQYKFNEEGNRVSSTCFIDDLVNSKEDIVLDLNCEKCDQLFDEKGKSYVSIVVVQKTKAISRTTYKFDDTKSSFKLNWLKDTLKSLIDKGELIAGNKIGHYLNVSFPTRLKDGEIVSFPVIMIPLKYKGVSVFREVSKSFESKQYEKVLELEPATSIKAEILTQMSLISDYKLGNSKRLFLDYKFAEKLDVDSRELDDYDLKIQEETNDLSEVLYDSLDLYYARIVNEKTESLIGRKKFAEARRMSLKVLDASSIGWNEKLFQLYTKLTIHYGNAISELKSKKEIKEDEDFKAYLDKSDQENAEIKKFLKKHFS